MSGTVLSVNEVIELKPALDKYMSHRIVPFEECLKVSDVHTEAVKIVNAFAKQEQAIFEKYGTPAEQGFTIPQEKLNEFIPEMEEIRSAEVKLNTLSKKALQDVYEQKDCKLTSADVKIIMKLCL